MIFNRQAISLLLLIGVSCSHAAKIFCAFPTPSYSHQQPMVMLSRALASKGHELTVLTTNPSEVPIKNLREIDLHHLYGDMNDHQEKLEKKSGFTSQKRSTVLQIIDALPGITDFLNANLFNTPQLIDLIKEVNGTKYDLLIYEPMMASSLLGFADLIGNPPIIGISTFHLPPTIDFELGNPVIPSYAPSVFSVYTHRMTLWQRIVNLYLTIYFNYVHDVYTRSIQEQYMWKYFGNYNTRLRDLEFKKSLQIVSIDLANGYPKPVQPNTIYVGPMHLQPPKPLPQLIGNFKGTVICSGFQMIEHPNKCLLTSQPDNMVLDDLGRDGLLNFDIQKWMDESEEGVIYFSLGSNMKGISVPEEIRAAFIKAFKQFPKVRVLWKWEADTKIPGQPDNVLAKKWLPQQPILAHPKLKLFISQVGLQSFEEATYYAVPILGIPMFGDQDFNAAKLVEAGVGLSIEFQDIKYDILYEKLNRLLTDPSFKKNMLRQSSIMKDKPMSSLDTAVWWVEYVLRHNGAPHLRPASLDLTWYQYYMLDILFILFVIILIGLFTTYFLIKRLMCLLISFRGKSNKLKRN